MSTTTTTTAAAAADYTIVRAPMPVTDAARRLQARLWAVTYGLDVVHNAANPLDVTEWVSTLFAEYGNLLVSRQPIFEWPHFEPTRPVMGVVIPCYNDGTDSLRLPPLLWLLLLDDRRCATTENKETRRGPIMACLSQLVHTHGLLLHDAYAYIARAEVNWRSYEIRRWSARPLPFMMKYVDEVQLVHAPLRALLTLGADPNDFGTPMLHKHSPLYKALTIEDGLDAAQLLLDYGARLDPAEDGGVVLEAMTLVFGFTELERFTRLVPLLSLHRKQLSGLENAGDARAPCKDWGVLHWLARQYAESPLLDYARIDHMENIIRGLHLRVGVSMLTLAKGEIKYDGDGAIIMTPKVTVLQYVRDLQQNTTAAEWVQKFNTPELVNFFLGRVVHGQRERLQELIDVIEPLDRAERVARRELAKAAELSLKRSRLFGGLTGELRRMVLRHVPAWAVQLPAPAQQPAPAQ